MLKAFSRHQHAPGTPAEREVEVDLRLCGEGIRGPRCLEPELESVLAAGA